MKNHDFSRSRPPAGQHPQKGITLFSKIEAARRATSTKRDNVKVNVNKVNVKVNVNKVNDKLNDIYSIHSHYKGNHRRGGSGRGASFVVTADGRHLCSGYSGYE